MAQIPSKVSDLKNTHLMDWLEQAQGHCLRGSKDWCDGYLHSASSYVFAMVTLINDHPSNPQPLVLTDEERGILLALRRYYEFVHGRQGDHTYRLPTGFDIYRVKMWIEGLENLYDEFPETEPLSRKN